MKICVNGITREMTTEEEAEYLTQREELTDSEALDILLGGEIE